MAISLMQDLLAVPQTVLAGAVGGLASWLGTLVVEKFRANNATKLEKVKATEALRQEFAKRRADKFGVLWAEFDNLEAKVTQLLFDILRLESQTNLELFLKDEGPDEDSELKVRLRILKQRQRHNNLQEAFATKFKNTFGTKIADLAARTESLYDSISPARFWLGEKVTNRLRLQCGTMQTYIETLRNFESDSEFTLNMLRELASNVENEKKDDLDSLLATL